jgi:hypothetical protein
MTHLSVLEVVFRCLIAVLVPCGVSAVVLLCMSLYTDLRRAGRERAARRAQREAA